MLSTLNLTVTTLSDPSGPGSTVSLRQAINTANADTVDSQVNIGFAASLKVTIDLTTALPNLANNISINGPGASVLTVQRDSNAAQFSVFTVNNGVTDISGMTISGGSAVNGGGIDNNGTLTVDNSTFTNNNGLVGNSSCGGGGIYNGGLSQ